MKTFTCSGTRRECMITLKGLVYVEYKEANPNVATHMQVLAEHMIACLAPDRVAIYNVEFSVDLAIGSIALSVVES